jgi:two-component system, OmpR family, phosphate regulon sensor histidine kinase PhoR
MKLRRVRLTRLLVGLAVVGTALPGVVVVQVALGMLADAGAEPEALRNATALLLGTIVLVGTWVALSAWVAGRVLTRALEEAATTLVTGEPGGAGGAVAGEWLAEVEALNRARARLSAGLGRREAELEREDEGRRVLLDSLSEGILQLDAGGRVVRANAAVSALFGLVVHEPPQPFSTQIRSAELRRILREAAAGRAVEATELTLDERRLLISVRPLPAGANGASAGAVVGVVDLTELRRLEGVRRDFVANVSHELKTPLTSIRGYVETLLADDVPAELRQQFLEVIRKNADRLQRIVDELLDLSRLQSGGWRPELDEVDAIDVIEDVWAGCRDRAAGRGIVFVPPRERVTVLADPGGLRQILSNLLDNALRYTPDGGRIEIATTRSTPAGTTRSTASNGHRRRAFVTFAVSDNGVGIPSDALSRIFERFYRVDPARSRLDGGTGLGLAIVKHLVERMGGDVRAESTLGKGTTIRFRLPAPP